MNPAIEHAARNEFPHKESFGYWLMPQYYAKEDAAYTTYCTQAVAQQAIVMTSESEEEYNPSFWQKVKDYVHEKGARGIAAKLVAITIIFFLILGVILIAVFLA